LLPRLPFLFCESPRTGISVFLFKMMNFKSKAYQGVTDSSYGPFAASLLAGLFLLSGCITSGTPTEEARSGIPAYPAWFLNPPADPGFTTGFAGNSFFEETAAEQALLNGSLRLRSSAGMQIQYTTFWERLPDDRTLLTGAEFLTDTLSRETPHVHLITSVSSGRMYLAALSSGNSSNPVHTDQRLIYPGTEPSWVKHPPKARNGKVYATGYSPVFYYEHQSWQRAEEQALKNLAMENVMRHQSATYTLNGATGGMVMHTGLARIRTWRVVSRWRDARNSYVLVEAEL
jgi:hypothetical protein